MSNRPSAFSHRLTLLASVCASVVLFLGAATPAHAQIYSWRDAEGRLTLSNHPRTDGVSKTVYAVPKANDIRTTRAVSSSRSELYDELLVEHARRNSVRPDLVRAVVQVESGYNPYARSSKGAMGLMQLMPATARDYGVVNPYDPADNVRAGVAYLRQLLDRYQNNEELALAAYNAGPGAVDKYDQSVPPYAETKSYVARINQLTKRPLERRDSRIYKVEEIVDGRPIVRYTDKKPSSGSYTVIGR